MAKKIQWYYHRGGWTSCIKAQEFLANANIQPKEVEKPSKPPYGKEKAQDLISESSKLLAIKGKKVLSKNLKNETVSDEEIARYMLGPTGNLRAPTMVVGKTLLVGFNQEVFEEVFGWSLARLDRI